MKQLETNRFMGSFYEFTFGSLRENLSARGVYCSFLKEYNKNAVQISSRTM